MTFNDGVQTPRFGQHTETSLLCPLEIPSDKIAKIRVQHNVKTATIQALWFETASGHEVEFRAKLADGRINEITLKKGQKLVGCYGFVWSTRQPEIVGLGFVIWTPV